MSSITRMYIDGVGFVDNQGEWTGPQPMRHLNISLAKEDVPKWVTQKVAEQAEKEAKAESIRLASYVSPTGAKRDNIGKVRYSLLPLDLLDGCVRVFSLGEKKYGRNNYRNKFPPLNALDSLLRHVTSLQRALETEDVDGAKGHLLDAESGEAHAHHALCSLLILIDSMRPTYKI